jgi:hypothetical protein
VHYDEALAHIQNLTQPQVYRLEACIKKRRSVLNTQRAAQINARITVGAGATITGRLKNEAALTGVSGIITAIYDDTNADLLLDEKSTQAIAAEPSKARYIKDSETSR